MPEINEGNKYPTLGEALNAEILGIPGVSETGDPGENATAFQAWINSKDEEATLLLPPWTIPLSDGLDFGQRNVVGQGNETVLLFSSLGSTTDAVTISSGTSPATRSGRISNLKIDMQGTGRDGIRWTGGLGCRAENVRVEDAGRDAFHFEQDANEEYFERAHLGNCEATGAGRYGLCIVLADFGADDVQFFNKSSFVDTRLFGCEVADVALFLNDADGGGTDTKIGGGITFINFHAQYEGAGTIREGCAFYIERGADSVAFIDNITFLNSTFEWNNSSGNADTDGALKIVDNASGDPIIKEFYDQSSLLTGYGRWWNYNNTSPIGGVYRVQNPLIGPYTNESSKWLGTPASLSGATSVGANSTLDLFDASTERVWLVIGRHNTNPARHAKAYICGGTTPSIMEAVTASNLSIDLDGTTVRFNNTNGFSIGLHWSVHVVVG